MQVAARGATREIASFASSVSYDTLPRSVVEKAKEIILDQVGAELACATLPTGRVVYDYVKQLRIPGNSTVVNHGLKTNPEYAAICNATFGHGFEIDDYHMASLTHPGCVAVPTMLAVGEERGSTGKDVLLGVALASELIVRMGLSFGRSMVMGRGFHMACVEGTIGGAAGAGRMTGLSEEQLLNALSIAGSHSSGVLEYGQTGGDVKRLHAGLGAMGALRSTALAKIGLTAPPTILEGKRGIVQAFADEYDLAPLTARLGERYHLLEIGVKPYCCCGLIHSPIDAVAALVSQHDLKPSDIAEITIGTSKLAISHAGTLGPEAKDVAGAQFSCHFSLGLTVAKRANDFKAYYDAMKAGFQDPEVLAVARRVKLEVDEECESKFPELSIAKATIKTKDGRTLQSRVEVPKGDAARNPVTRDELIAKFMGLATVVVSEDKVNRIKDMILGLEKLEDIRELTALLVA